MTDRIKGCWVGFDKDYREDDVQKFVDAIKMIKGVQSVTLSVADSDDWMNREHVKSELTRKLWDVLTEK